MLLLEVGSYVPADARLVETAHLRVEEASLTGESVPVDKAADGVVPEDTSLGDRATMVYAGTAVAHGQGRAVVTGTGSATELGGIARLLGEIDEGPTPLQQRLEGLGRWLAMATLSICGVVFLVGLLRGMPLLDGLLTAVSLAVAAVPEGLPAVVTIVLALGMQTWCGATHRAASPRRGGVRRRDGDLHRQDRDPYPERDDGAPLPYRRAERDGDRAGLCAPRRVP